MYTVSQAGKDEIKIVEQITKPDAGIGSGKWQLWCGRRLVPPFYVPIYLNNKKLSISGSCVS
jgi:hypothetical protein